MMKFIRMIAVFWPGIHPSHRAFVVTSETAPVRQAGAREALAGEAHKRIVDVLATRILPVGTGIDRRAPQKFDIRLGMGSDFTATERD